MPGPGSQLGTLYTSEGMEGGGGELQQARNPLICYLCDDYYTDPCLLQCYHTFCSKCLRGREADGRILCPLCGNITSLKENAVLPPTDNLMKQLIEMVNAENPPCANCDKRDKNSMFFCSTCGQSLCNQCRENTHRAKMFSTHDIVHMSKCGKESQKRCPIHGELYIMFNNAQKSMLCVTCFRDTPNETRMHCVDIDSAYNQSSKKLDRAVISLCEVQNSVRESLLMFKTLLEELRHNMDCEKHTINTFCQGMQESIAKTHSNMIMEVQRQYEAKERSFRGHLVNLSIMLPVIQHHLLLCQSFTNIANKFQFLDLASMMIDRLSAIAQLTQPQRPIQSSQIRTNFRNEFMQCLEPWIGKSSQSISRMIPTQDTALIEQLNAFPLPAQTPSQPSKRQQNALRTKAMEGEGPFSNHCRSFDSQIKELSQQLSLVKERLNDLHRDVSLLRRAQTPPLTARYQRITGDCSVLEEQLERHQVELERMKNVFDTLWEEQMCRIHVEQDIFQSQTNEILTLRAEVKHLATVAQQLEPYIKSLTNVQMVVSHKMSEHKTPSTQQVQEMSAPSVQLQTLLDHINALQLDSSKFHSQAVTSPTGPKNLGYSKEAKERPRPKTPSQSPGALVESGRNVIYESRQPGESGGGGDKRGSVFSQLIEKVRTKDDRKKSLDADRGQMSRDKSKSVEVVRSKPGLEDGQTVQKQPGGVAKSKGKKEMRYMRDGKVASVYQSISGRVLGSKSDQGEVDDLRRESQLPPPPPPARRTPFQDQGSDIRERLETHLKEKLQEMAARSSISKHLSRMEKSHSADADIIEDINYQRISEALSCSPEDVKATRVLVHRDSQGKAGSTSTSPRRQERRSVERERSRERRDKRDRSRDGRDRSQSRDRSKEDRQKVRPREGRERSRERRVRRDKYGRFYPASDTEDNVFYQNGVARKQHSFDSLTLSPVSVDSRKSSADMNDRKTLVLVIGNRKGSSKQKMLQRSWETFPPKKKNYDPEYYGGDLQEFQVLKDFKDQEVENSEKCGAKITKPSEKAEDELSEELSKGIRGRRKPLYASPLKSPLKFRGTSSSASTAKVAPVVVVAKKPSLQQTCQTPQLHREGTFTKEDGSITRVIEGKNLGTTPVLNRNLESKNCTRLPSKNKFVPSGGNPKTVGESKISRIGRPLSTYASRANDKRMEADSSQRRPFSAGAGNRTAGESISTAKKPASGSPVSQKMRNSSSSQNMKAGNNAGSNASVKNRNFNSQSGKSQSDASLNLVDAKDKVNLGKAKNSKKEVTSKIATLWRKVEETKEKNKNLKDTRVWIGPEQSKTSSEALVMEKEEIVHIPTRTIVHSFTCQALTDGICNDYSSQERNSQGISYNGMMEERQGKTQKRNIISAVVPPYNYNPPVPVVTPSSFKEVDDFPKSSLKVTTV